ncbi:(-)-germacrene D synthase [Actinidia chinensis var. chinensis]|uniref:(-)-germacrene D synthase n=1 Tax=Actinidia chinensis var. chinensis TaxID=1590841 RepID=A0A2R6R4L4_ACTCC|nr:(-)-germacrene D synthase [Actinidia chinensis var. chinensis]
MGLRKLFETYTKEVEVLKEEVRSMLVGVGRKPAEKMILINALERLGVFYLFEKDIEDQIQQMFTNFEDSHDDDLFTVALHFRIFRQHGYKMSCDVFNNFRGSNGNFKETLTNDIMGMLSLYEATYLKIHGEEDVLDKAHAFAKAHLESMASHSILSPFVAEQVMHALIQPLHRGVQRVEARHYISVYEKDESRDEKLLRLAKIDFNRLQMLHKQELCNVSRWWKDLDLASKVSYTRDRALESMLWSTFVCFEPQYSLSRVILAQFVQMLTVADDTYDAYGTYEELKLLTSAVQRWDVSATHELPTYIKPFYVALLNFFDELEKEMAKQGRVYAVHYSKESFKELVEGYNMESEWLKEGYIPSFDEYLAILGVVTSTVPLCLTSSFVGMEEIATAEAFAWAQSRPKIVIAASIMGRLHGDIMSHEEEQKRVHVPSGVECYMKQHGVSKQEAIGELYKRIEDLWKDMNEEMLIRPAAVPMPLLMRVLNLSRGLDVLFKYGDGFTHVENVKAHVISFYEDPIPV